MTQKGENFFIQQGAVAGDMEYQWVAVFAVALLDIANQSMHQWELEQGFAAEEAEVENFPSRCLAGVCLNTKSMTRAAVVADMPRLNLRPA
ncbi:hypothetical protein [Thioflavicoccus mobilis]|uniref:hypothetical protein n=1 Tax=Thioflavicoccus mobilis TaxID=80679 RepID=UPI0005A0DDF9|nr:hypothetical protein [Thioflavicoccus mobilis]